MTEKKTTSSKEQSIRRNDVVNLHEGIWQITKGYAYTQTLSSQGDYQITGIWKTGDILLNPSPGYVYEMKAIHDVGIMKVAPCPAIMEGLLGSLIKSQQFITIVKVKAMESRLMELLKWLSVNFGEQLDTHKAQGFFRLTHNEMASVLGSTRVTVTRLLQDLEERGAIVTGKRSQGIIVEID